MLNAYGSKNCLIRATLNWMRNKNTSVNLVYVLTLLDPSEGTTSGFSMKAASDDARLLKKVAANHRQPLTSKPAFPDWTQDAWLLIFAFTLFVFCSSLYRFCISAFIFCFPLSVPPPLSPPLPTLAFYIRPSSKPPLPY